MTFLKEEKFNSIIITIIILTDQKLICNESINSDQIKNIKVIMISRVYLSFWIEAPFIIKTLK
jgi:hypothetical protein